MNDTERMRSLPPAWSGITDLGGSRVGPGHLSPQGLIAAGPPSGFALKIPLIRLSSRLGEINGQLTQIAQLLHH